MARRPPVRLPEQWPDHVKSGILHAISLANVVLAFTRAHATGRRRPRAQLDQANTEIALLREELNIKDGRWQRAGSRRKPHYAPTGITPGPNEAWMMQIGRNLTDPVDGFLVQKKFLLLDRDSKYSALFRNLLKDAGIDVVRLPSRSPNLNAYAERFVRSIKDECLNRMIFFGERSLRKATIDYSAHYHAERNHQGLDNRLIEPRQRAISTSVGKGRTWSVESAYALSHSCALTDYPCPTWAPHI